MRLAVGLAALNLSCLATCQVVPLADTLVKQAESAYQARHYQESVRLYAQALPLLQDSERAGTEYNMACSQARAGERNAAMTTLESAVQDGYSSRRHTEVDKDLVSLHDDPRWMRMLELMTAADAEEDKRWSNKAFVTPYAADLSAAEKLAGLSELWAQAKYGFANFWHVPQLDWDRTYQAFIPQVLNTSSTREYYQVLQRFYAQLQDGHTNVYFPSQISDQMARLPLRTRLIEGHLLVVGSRNPAADLQGVMPGDEVLTVNGEPATTWAQKTVDPFISASSPQDRATRVFEYMPFVGTIGATYNLVIQSSSGEKTTHRFTLQAGKSVPNAPFTFRMLPGNLAYVALNEFEDDVDEIEWDKHWPEISKAQGVILDIRENGGGSTSIGSHVLATLINKPFAGELSRSTRWIATYRAWGRPETPIRFPPNLVQPDATHRYAGQVILLTSPRTFSAAEDMAVMFKQAKRGLIIGEPTGGSSGQPLFFDLPGGGRARVCTKHDSFADGTEFVGVGVQPDVAAHLSRKDLAGNQDSVLQAAVKAIGSVANVSLGSRPSTEAVAQHGKRP